MSIINDALKKAQKTIGISDARTKKGLIKRYPIYIIVLIFGVVTEVVVFSLILRPPDKLKPQHVDLAASPAAVSPLDIPSVPAAVVRPVPIEKAPPTLSLNGIFFSENKGYYALINNRIAKIGDNIDGAIVILINLEEVQLTFDGKTIRLRN